MIPAALTTLLSRGAKDFLRASFWSSTPGMETVVDRFVDGDGDTRSELFQGPFVSVKLPFRPGTRGEFFDKVPLGFPAHLHQERAFRRLGGDAPENTLVATGTGSGKTEAFQQPILDYCRRHAGKPGVKAILIYPMNALATDQAGRIARAIARCPSLGGVRAGLYIGETQGEKRKAQTEMGATSIITSRERMQKQPPDILLTNYKMLDFLLVRPTDQELWAPNEHTPLRFLVVDELHTFDGAQGTDLACLIRRLKARLGRSRGELCCVGTSATLGSEDSASTLKRYAEDIFGETFDAGSVVTEARMLPDEFFPPATKFEQPADADAMDPARYGSPEDYLTAQAALWLPKLSAFEPSDAWRVRLGEELLTLTQAQNLVRALRGGTRPLNELTTAIGLNVEDPEAQRAALVSLLSLVSAARSWLPEHEDTREAREEAGGPRPTRPLMEVRVQLWLREMARIVGSVDAQPRMRFSDDLTSEQLRNHLPLIHCRDCGAMGWATWTARDRPDLYSVDVQRFYRAYFGSDPQVRFLWPAKAAREPWDDEHFRVRLDKRSLVRVRGDHDPDDVIEVAESPSSRTVRGKKRLHRDCPFCEAKGSLTLVGFRAARLTSVWIDQLFASPFNDDKKLIAFSDSVQDAAHRAGYFGARTWRFNRRVAQQKMFPDAEGLPLSKLPAAFVKRWRGEQALTPEEYVTTFLPPNMEWLPDYEEVIKTGAMPAGSELTRLVDRRMAYEIYSEYGMQSRIGRSLPRTGCSTVSVDPARLDRATAALIEPLRNEVGGLRQVSESAVRTMLLGACHRLRERGGILHDELPAEFIETSGGKEYAFKLAPYKHLPGFGKRSRFPALLTEDSRSSRFDHVFSAPWYTRWVQRCLGGDAPLMGSPVDVWGVVLPGLVEHGLLKQVLGQRGRVWGLAPEALIATAKTHRLRCPECRHWQVVAAAESDAMRGSPCLAQPCDGRYEDAVSLDAGPSGVGADREAFFGRFIRSAEVERVFPKEHTGLLGRTEREAVEKHFKAETSRKPWYPNLLSCTPTLEMGIDIGTLSSAVLCSVPPAQANYLQRIGRAGRRDGNSMLLTIAMARPHDNYFFAQPHEMISGEVRPPGVFLNASAVLERQLAAHTLDRWNAAPGEKRIAVNLKEIFRHLGDGTDESTEHFPQSWLAYVRTRQEELVDDFIALFDPPATPESERRLDDATRAHLVAFLTGVGAQDDGSLSWRVLDALHAEKRGVAKFRRNVRRLADTLKEMKAAKARDKDHEQQIAEVEREKDAIERLARRIERTRTLEFLTAQGLLPNYAFPESPVRLRSVIWRRRANAGEGDAKYETKTHEYARPAMAAISELAPHSEFFAGARRVEIDQVDVASAQVESWRFCDRCSYAQNLAHGDESRNCPNPNCQSEGWGEESQKRPLLRMHQVFARTSDKNSRIRDDKDERQPRFFNRHMLPNFANAEAGPAWKIPDSKVPFAFQYAKGATFREINFGEFSDQGMKFSIAGRAEVRGGFEICKLCGKVQPDERRRQTKTTKKKDDVVGEHTLWCAARSRGAKAKDFQSAIYLYREFSSEAVRMLLPLADIGTEEGLHSFVAAFQLGLRDKYGGQVDHLQTLVYTEPEKEGLLRKQFLVVFDTVPGGTGYLKEFARAPVEGQLHPMLDLLKRARDRMRSCVCFSDDTRDGCYRCLLAYRNSREMAATSSKTALKLISEILEHADALQRTDSLSDISVAGLMDSVLEARFIEALTRMHRGERPVVVDKRVVRGKSGYYAKVGLTEPVEWLIEPQLDLGPAQGVAVPVSIDFVLRPTGGADRRPIAVFLDGYQHHKGRIGQDLLQRMALQSAGEYDVWSFTWDDIDQVFRNSADMPQLLLHPNGAELKDWWRQLGFVAHARMIDASPMELLVASLGRREETVPWGPMAAVALAAQMSLPNEVDRSAWHREVMERAPEALRPVFDEIPSGALLLHRPPEDPGDVGVWGYAPPDAVADPTRFGDFRVLFWFDDREELREERAVRDGWRGLLHALTFLRHLDGVFFATAAGPAGLDFPALLRVRGATDDELGEWRELGIEPDFEFLIPHLVDAGVEVPEVGTDLPSPRGLTSGVDAELLWEARKVGVLEAIDEETLARVDSEWRLFAVEALAADPTPLLQALQKQPASAAVE